MLESTLFESQGSKKTRKPVTLAVSAFAHVATVAVLVVIPLLQTHALTIPPLDMSLFLPRVERRPSLPVFSAQPQTRRPTTVPLSTLTSPASIPEHISPVEDPPLPDLPFLQSGVGTGFSSIGTSLTNPTTEIPTPAMQPPAPPPPPPVVRALPFRLGGDVQAAKLIYQVKPEYPAIARQTRTQGVVVLEAVIGRDGSIDSLRMISGHPLLTRAALDAVKQWKYRPTLLNGEPTEVITTVTVTFTLQ